jgi:histidinol-phosphate aminotransferase
LKVSPEIQNLLPYTPGKPIEETQREFGLSKVYKLASNENPLGPSPLVQAAITKAIGQLHRYPDAAFFDLRKKFSQHFRLNVDEITFGNGSNELIDLLVRIFCEPGQGVLTAENAFIAYRVCTQAARAKLFEVPMTSDLRFDLRRMAEQLAILHQQGQHIPLVFIANPNNPTGTYVTDRELIEFVGACKKFPDTLVVIDEAYLEFVRAKDYPDALELMRSSNQVVVMRTLSKVFGIAGLRVGSLFAHRSIVDLVDRVRNPFNVNSLAQAAALVALDDVEFLHRVQKLNWEGLDFYYRELAQLDVKFWKSEANFVLIDTHRDARAVYEKMLRRGVIVRPAVIGKEKTYLRLSVGLEEENQAAISALKEVLPEVARVR